MRANILKVTFLFLFMAQNAIGAGVQSPAPTPSPNADYTPSVISSCDFPLGRYKYLFTDGFQTYYFSNTHTIYVTPEGDRIIKKGNFKLQGKVSSYQRLGDRFIYTNPAGTYTSINGGEINYSPSAVAAQIVALTPKYKDNFGSYRKEGGKIIFTPARKLPDLEVTKDNCEMVSLN